MILSSISTLLLNSILKQVWFSRLSGLFISHLCCALTKAKFRYDSAAHTKLNINVISDIFLGKSSQINSWYCLQTIDALSFWNSIRRLHVSHNSIENYVEIIPYVSDSGKWLVSVQALEASALFSRISVSELIKTMTSRHTGVKLSSR